MGPIQIPNSHQQRYQDPHLELDFEHRIARLDAKPLGLTRKEYDLLELLIHNAGEVVGRQTLLFQVWGYNNQVRTRTLDVHIRRLRKKLGERSGSYIETIFGVGYRFQPYRAPRAMPAPAPVMAVSA